MGLQLGPGQGPTGVAQNHAGGETEPAAFGGVQAADEEVVPATGHDDPLGAAELVGRD